MENHSREREGWQNFTRGAEIWLHQTRMMFMSGLLVFGFSIAMGFASIYLGLTIWLSDVEGYYTQKYYEASVKGWMFKERAKIKIIIDDREQEVDADYAKAASSIFKDNALWKLYVLSLIGLFCSAASFVGIMWYLTKYGDSKMQDDHVRGGKLTDGEKLKKALIENKDASDYTIADIPLRKGSESYHIGIIGAQGTGKTVAIMDILDQLRKNGKKVAVYDPTGQFIECFYREGKDVILNPLDARSPRWTPWNEVRDSYDYMNLAEDLLPLPPGNSDPFWSLAGRQIFEDICFKLAEAGRTKNSVLYKSIALAELDKVYEMLKGTAGASYVSPSVEKTGQSIRMVVINALKSFKFLHDDGPSFSLRDWIDDDSTDSWVFISSRESQKPVLKPLISLWMGILIRYSMGLNPIFGTRHWLVFDELAGLHRLEMLDTGMTNLRKFGVPIVAGFQLYPQIQEIYGEAQAKTIISQFQTKLVLRVGEGDTAEALAKDFGKAEVDEKEETYSYGINAQRDGVSVFARRNMRDIVMSSEIRYLPDLTGYYTIPADYPVAKVKYTYKQREKVAVGFVGREGFRVSHAKSSEPVAPSTLVQSNVKVDVATGEILVPIQLYQATSAVSEPTRFEQREEPEATELRSEDDSDNPVETPAGLPDTADLQMDLNGISEPPAYISASGVDDPPASDGGQNDSEHDVLGGL